MANGDTTAKPKKRVMERGEERGGWGGDVVIYSYLARKRIAKRTSKTEKAVEKSH
jgi:hypothetical protein